MDKRTRRRYLFNPLKKREPGQPKMTSSKPLIEQLKPKVFDQKEPHRSFALVVEGQKFWISRDILAAYSPVFQTMLFGDFAEAEKDCVPLPEKKAAEIEELLLCLIPNPTVKAVDGTNVDSLLRFADEYDIKDLWNRCQEFLISKLAKCGKSDPALLNILRVASKHKMRAVLESCIERCATEFDLNQLQEVFPELRSEVIAGLIVYLKSSFSQTSTHCAFEITRKVTAGAFYYSNSTPEYTATCVKCGREMAMTSINYGSLSTTNCSGNQNRPLLPPLQIKKIVGELLDRI